MDEKKKQASGPVKWILIGISVIFLFVMLVLPLVVVVTQALSKGWECYVQAVTDEYTLKALALRSNGGCCCMQHDLRPVCSVGNDQISFPGKKASDDADRHSGYGVTGHRRSYLYSGFWKAEPALFCS